MAVPIMQPRNDADPHITDNRTLWSGKSLQRCIENCFQFGFEYDSQAIDPFDVKKTSRPPSFLCENAT
jgi:hypothetical protein